MAESVRVQRPLASAAEPPGAAPVRRLGWISAAGIGSAIAVMVGASFVRQDWMYPPLRAPRVGPPFELHTRVSGTLVTGCLWAAALLAVVGLAAGLLAARRGAHGPIRLMLIGAALATVALMLLPPAGSTDALDYAAYGRLALFGHNPYVATPLYIRITDPAFAQSIPVRWQEQVSLYGPAATIEQYLAAKLGGDSIGRVVFWLKMWNALAFGAVAFVLDRVLRAKPTARLRAHLLWTVNPLLLWVLVAAGHVDVVAAAAGLVGLLAIGRPTAGTRQFLWRAAGAGVLVGVAADIKIDFALFGLGLAWALRRSVPALLAAVGGALVVLAPTYAWLGRPAFNALFARTDKTSQDSFYRFADLTNWRFLIVFALVLFVGIAILLLRRLPPGDALRPAVRSTLAISVAWLIIWPYQLPWYDAMIFSVLALYPASALDWVLLARLGAATIGTMPGNPNGVPGRTLRSADVFLVHGLVPAVLLGCAVAVLALAISGQWGVQADVGPRALPAAPDPGTLSGRGGERRLVRVRLAGRRRMERIAEVKDVDPVQPAACVADLVTGESAPDVAEYITVPGGSRLQLAVQFVGGSIEVLAIGRAQPDADGRPGEVVQLGITEEHHASMRRAAGDVAEHSVQLARQLPGHLGLGGLDGGDARVRGRQDARLHHTGKTDVIAAHSDRHQGSGGADGGQLAADHRRRGCPRARDECEARWRVTGGPEFGVGLRAAVA
jgi:hypothetical protein